MWFHDFCGYFRKMITDELLDLSMIDKLRFKQRFTEFCLSIIHARVKVLQEAVGDAQDSANNEDKSSAGDKHETARALSQNARDLNASVLSEALKDLNTLTSLKKVASFKSVQMGSLVVTSSFNAMICVNLGKIDFEGVSIMCISSSAPIAQRILKLTNGDKFIFNNSETLLLDAF